MPSAPVRLYIYVRDTNTLMLELPRPKNVVNSIVPLRNINNAPFSQAIYKIYRLPMLPNVSYPACVGYVGYVGYVRYVGYVGQVGYVGYVGHVGCVGYVGYVGNVGYVGHAYFPKYAGPLTSNPGAFYYCQSKLMLASLPPSRLKFAISLGFLKCRLAIPIFIGFGLLFF